jgi:hypothetical protein
MSLAELKQEAEHLTPEERRHLTAHLVALERKSDPSFKRRLADKIDDKTPGQWVDLDQIKAI